MARYFSLVAAVGILIGAGLIGGGAASAGTPPVRTATPTSTPTEASSAATATVTPSPADLVLRFDDATFTWMSVSGAASYHLTGSVFVVRINAADAFCTPPLAEQSMTVPVDATLPSDATSFPLPLPALPAVDAWFVVTEWAELSALDASGAGVTGARIGLVAETNRGCPIRDIGLPATGEAAPPSVASGAALWALLAAAVFGLIGSAACLLGRRSRC